MKEQADGKNYFSAGTTFNQKVFQKLEYSFFLRYAFTVFVSALVITVKYAFFPHFQTPYLLALIAVIVSALYAGFIAGLLAGFITLLSVNYLFVPPQFTFKAGNLILLDSLIYCLQTVFVSILIAREKITRNKAYQQAEEFFVTLSSIGDAVITTDIKGNILFMNKVAEDLTGWTNREVLGKKINFVFNIINEKTKKRVANPVIKVLKQNKIVGLGNHTELIRKDKTRIPIDDSAAPIRDSRKKLTGVVLTFRDITQRREVEQRKDDFVSIASHELKTPVTSIKLFIQLLKKRFKNSEDINLKKVISSLDGQMNKLTELINDLLDLSRIQSGKSRYKKEIFSVDNLVAETIDDLRQVYPAYELILEGKIRKKLLADRDRIRQVLINLISNAVKYSNSSKKVMVKLYGDNEKAIVEIQDYGIGIPKEEQNKIFNRFYQISTKKKDSSPGLGLGLYISSEIIKGHNGKILVDSEVGKGSTFQFLLPFPFKNSSLKK